MTDWITGLVERLGHAGIALLMFLENLFPPIPSEIIMPLAGYTAADGQLSIAGVLAAGTAGTVAGAIFWYHVAKWLGEERLKRWAARHGRWITLSPDEIDGLNRRFRAHSGWAVPLAHLVPGVRTLISIPAGLFGMGLPRFLLLTTLGAGAWTSALGLAGWWLGSRYEQVDRYLGPASTAILAAILILYIYRVVTFGRRSGT